MAVPLSASGCAVVASSGDGGFNMKLGGRNRPADGLWLNPRNT